MSQADGPAGMLSPGGTLPQEGAGSQNESWRSQEETWRLRFRITELLNSLEEKLLFRQLFQEETERKEKKMGTGWRKNSIHTWKIRKRIWNTVCSLKNSHAEKSF